MLSMIFIYSFILIMLDFLMTSMLTLLALNIFIQHELAILDQQLVRANKIKCIIKTQATIKQLYKLFVKPAIDLEVYMLKNKIYSINTNLDIIHQKIKKYKQIQRQYCFCFIRDSIYSIEDKIITLSDIITDLQYQKKNMYNKIEQFDSITTGVFEILSKSKYGRSYHNKHVLKMLRTYITKTYYCKLIYLYILINLIS